MPKALVEDKPLEPFSFLVQVFWQPLHSMEATHDGLIIPVDKLERPRCVETTVFDAYIFGDLLGLGS